MLNPLLPRPTPWRCPECGSRWVGYAADHHECPACELARLRARKDEVPASEPFTDSDD